MSHDRPLAFDWDGESFIPRSPKRADERYVIGETYWLVPHEERTTATHGHQFAWLKDAWLQLPEALAELYPTPMHLRKRALIDSGFYDETIVDAGSGAAALRVAAAFRSREEFALVIVRGPLVVIRTAKSQSRRSMNKHDFQASKTAILEVVSNMIGIAPEELTSQRTNPIPLQPAQVLRAAGADARPDRTPPLAHLSGRNRLVRA